MKPLLSCAISIAAAGCTFHSTGSNEVGVLTRKVSLFGKAGVQSEHYDPGSTYTFPAFITDWNTFRTDVQNLHMTADPNSGDRKSRDDVEFKTHDGNDIAVDVTITWQVIPDKAPQLLMRVADSTEAVKEKLVRPLCRSIFRDVMGTLTSEEFYTEKRFKAAIEARERLAAIAAPEGVRIIDVLLHGYRFHKQYEAVIQEKKLAEVTAGQMESEGHAAQQEALSKLETAKGQVEQKIARARGQLEQTRLEADSGLYQSKARAEAIRAEKEARAKGIRKQNEALAGAGGRTLVKLRIAEALEGKQIVFLPSGGKGGALQTVNLNELLSRYAAAERIQDESKESK